MKFVSVAIVLTFSTLSFAGCTQHDPKSAAGLIAAEHRWVAALDGRDQQALGCILGPEFKDSGVRGEVRDRAKVLADLPQRRPAQQHLQNLEPLLFGNSGVVRGLNHLTTGDGKSIADIRFTDVFVYRDNRWQAVSAQETIISTDRK